MVNGNSDKTADVGTPAISLPKGGGAIKGIGETFQPNLFSGTGNYSVPIITSPGRNGFGPKLSLQYSSGSGNGPFGLGWQLSVPRITRKTEKGLPGYRDTDVFVMSGAEDLVIAAPNLQRTDADQPSGYTVTRFRPRTEGLFARIECWKNDTDNRDVHWRAITKENVTSIYGKSSGKLTAARIVDPDEPHHIFEWLLEETFDAKGNHILYEYVQENTDLVLTGLHEKNHRYTQTYLRRVLYGNTPDDLLAAKRVGHERNGTDLLDPQQIKPRHYAFELLFDYDDLPDVLIPGFDWAGLSDTIIPSNWPVRNDPFSSFRSGFEIRTLRQCRRVLMLHHFDEGELTDAPLVKSTDFTYYTNEDTRLSFLSEATVQGYRKKELMTVDWNTHAADLRALTISPSLTQAFDNVGIIVDTSASLKELSAGVQYQLVTNDDCYLLKRDGTNLEVSAYLSRDMPPVSFKYSVFKPEQQRYQELRMEGNDYPPVSLNHPTTSFMDVFGDGMTDVVQSTSSGIHYWQNLGEGQFGRRHPQHGAQPPVSFEQPNVSIGDMGGDGLADLVVDAPPMSGLYESTPDGEWKTFKRFKAMPSFDLSDPNTRLVDLTGDGLSDVLVTRDAHFLWFQSLGEDGYAMPKAIPRQHDMESFPDVYFNDPAGRVRLADMTGDGLNDIVYMHDGSIDYWPNLGYGRFGKRLRMTKAPRIGYSYDPRRMFLADLDGSGTADLVYVDFDRVRFWFNRSGNGWSQEKVINGTPFVTDLTALQFADILGTGITALVWSYDYGSVSGGNYKYLDFCGGVKPNLLIEMDNNMGATTRAQYAASTKFYLEDKKDGTPWVTTLPFPVQVLEKTEVIDHISKTKLVTTYKYHHGYYDGREREFRGFGCVDQIDTEYFEAFSQTGLHGEDINFENANEARYVPPVLTRNWFHTGVYFDDNLRAANGEPYDKEDMLAAFREEYYQEDHRVFAIEGNAIAEGRTATPHEAYRVLRGALLRSEVYALDGTSKQNHPYTVTENRYEIKELQAKQQNAHAVYLTINKESLSYHYERDPADPRISQSLTLAYDDYGNITQSVGIGYPRRRPLHSMIGEDGNPALDSSDNKPIAPYTEQRELKAIYTFSDFINKEDSTDIYFANVPYQSRVFEVHGLPWAWPAADELLVEPLRALAEDAFSGLDDPDIYEAFQNDPPADLSSPKKRIVDWKRSYFRKNLSPEIIDAIGHLDHRLALGEIESLGLPYESYQLALTTDLLQDIYQGRVTATQLALEGGYHPHGNHPDAEGSNLTHYWWIPSGRLSFDPSRFYAPLSSQDPFGNISTIEMDEYALLPVRVSDALPAPQTNIVQSHNDYRVLQPYEVIDPNGTHSQAAFDALGLMVGSAIWGEDENGNPVGDSLVGFEADLENTVRSWHIEDPLNRDNSFDSNPHNILRQATTRLIYDLKCYMQTGEPNVAYTLARETHVSDEQGTPSKIQHSFLYSDGFGREYQSKIQAEPGPIYDTNGDVSQANANPRWVGTGTKIYNNKGKPVEEYEPFFGDTHLPGIEQHGVSPVLFYDPLERVVCTLHPNHTWEKVVFDSWQQTTWDVSDTIHTNFRYDPTTGTLPDEDFSPSFDDDAGQFFRAIGRERYWPTWYKLRMNIALRDSRWPLIDVNGQPHSINTYRNPAKQRAARLAAQHANTPTTAHLDTLGRPFLTVADNGRDAAGNDVYFKTRVKLDIEGNDQSITDPRNIIAFQHKFDIAGRKLYVKSVDAGEKWLFLSVDNQPLYSWDANGNRIKLEFDSLRRPKRTTVQRPAPHNDEIISQASIYGEELATIIAPSTPNQHHLRGQIYAVVDGSGLSVNLNYDFKGNLTAAKKLLADSKILLDKVHPDVPDWDTIDFTQAVPQIEQALLPLLEDEVFYTFSRYDALNRVIESIEPDHSKATQAAAVPTDGSVYKMEFNEANLLDSIAMDIRAERAAGAPPGQSHRSFINNINYNARGQRESIEYGNGVVTKYTYDPETYRLLNLTTRRQNNALLQDLHHVYDPAGNISGIKDGAIKTIYHDQQAIEPVSQYQYDPSYRLIAATGREHKAMGAGHYRNANAFKQSEYLKLPPTTDTQALQMYTEVYVYDPSGNFTEIKHHRGQMPGGAVLWTRTQSYDGSSNHITTSGADATDPTRRDPVADYIHDANGNFKKLPQLKNGGQANAQNLHWDYSNQLIKADLDLNNNVAHYNYDATGQRTRKVVIKGGLREERIYLGNYEIYRKYSSAAAPTFERQTLHVMDDKQRIALIEHRTIGNENGEPATRFRYQLSNHLGSSVTEIDETDQAKIISHEEYYPYGGTVYIGGNKDKANEKIASSKRYRYSGKERDDETGLYYYGARYYVPWLGRWLSCDPAGIVDGINLFAYSRSNPIVFFDNMGFDSNGVNQQEIGGPEIRLEQGQEFTGKETRQELENIANNEGKTIKGEPYWEEGYGWRAELSPLEAATPNAKSEPNRSGISSTDDNDYDSERVYAHTGRDDFSRKWKIGKDAYTDLGLAGQIAEKLSPLPYRKGRIGFESGRLEKANGLVCTPFAKIFGGLWFTGEAKGKGNPKGQTPPGTESPASVYAEKYGGELVNKKRMKLQSLIEKLVTTKLYSVVSYKESTGKRQHIFFLIYYEKIGDWVRIEASGGNLEKGGIGAGPGIYSLDKKPANNRVYQAWDWGHADRPRNPAINNWDFSSRKK